MKLSSLALSLLVLILFAGIHGCNKETTAYTVKDLSPYVQKFLVRNSGSQNASALSKTSAVNQSFTGAVNTASVLGGNGPVTSSDTTIFGQPWQTCAVVTEIDNPDGSHTTIYDYGKGCNDGYADFKNFIHGKTTQTTRYIYTMTGSLIKSSYLYKYIYENYGGTYYYGADSTTWNMNGNSSYTGESSYDTTNFQFSGWYNFSDTTDYANGTDSYFYMSLGKSSYDQTKSVSEKNDYQYKTGDNYYQSVVTVPLVSDYTCRPVYSATNSVSVSPMNMAIWMVYVSGHEIIHYRQDGQEGVFEIDYGNGECDNRYTVTENGKTVVVDMNRDWALLTAAATGH